MKILACRTDNAGEFKNVKGWDAALVESGRKPEHSPSRHHHAVGKASAMQLELAKKIANHLLRRVGRNGQFLDLG